MTTTKQKENQLALIWMCTGDVREFSVLPVHDVNELDEVEAVQLQIAQGGPVERPLTAEQESRIDDIFEKVLGDSEHTSEPGAFENLSLGCQLSPRDLRGEPYYNGADDTVCLNFPGLLPINILFQVILRFLANNGRCKDAKSIAVWQLMEERQVLHGHSWQSMKERFLHSILKNLDSFDFLTKGQKQQLRGCKSMARPTAPLSLPRPRPPLPPPQLPPPT